MSTRNSPISKTESARKILKGATSQSHGQDVGSRAMVQKEHRFSDVSMKSCRSAQAFRCRVVRHSLSSGIFSTQVCESRRYCILSVSGTGEEVSHDYWCGAMRKCKPHGAVSLHLSISGSRRSYTSQETCLKPSFTSRLAVLWIKSGKCQCHTGPN